MRRHLPRRPDLTFQDALCSFLEAEGKDLLNGVSERQTCGRLAIYLEQQVQKDGFEGYYADVEYNRKQRGQVKTIIDGDERTINITPDLIVHTRGTRPAPDDNLIAIEVKKARRPRQEKEDDRNRLVAMTLDPYNGVWDWEDGHPEHVCGYAVGIYMEIDLVKREILLEFYKKGTMTKSNSVAF